jgi:hypothetical protein
MKHTFLIQAECPKCKEAHEVTFLLTLPDNLVANGKFSNCKEVLDLPKIEKVAEKAASK